MTAWILDALTMHLSDSSGVAAFFLKKFQQKKRLQQTRAPEVTETNRRPFSPSEINTYDDPYADPNDGSASRNSSRKSRKPSLHTLTPNHSLRSLFRSDSGLS